MRGELLRKLISTDKFIEYHFAGVFTPDTIIPLKKSQQFLICNTATEDQEGKHWILLFRSFSTIELFDPLGFQAIDRDILKSNALFLRGISNIQFNSNRLQSDDSVLCGEYCLLFIFNRIKQLDSSFHDIISTTFSNNLNENERRVSEFIRSLEQQIPATPEQQGQQQQT